MDSLYICSAVRDGAGAIVDFVFAYLNSNVQKMVSLSCEQMLGKRMCELLPVNRSLGLFDLYCKVVESGEPLVHEFAVTDNDVISTWIRIQAVKVRDGIAITASDITARKRDEASILHLAHHDPLTGLINRSLLLERIEQAIENAKRYGSKFGLLLIDLDGFKQVNDTLGHAAGDAVLVMTAQRLHAAVRAIDSVIRMGGDEFLVVLRDIDEMRHLTLCASKILGVVQDPYPLNNQWVRITCSVGAAMYTGAALTCEDLIGHADAAMYTAKRRGKNQVEVYAHAELPERVSFSARPTSISGGVH
jgi:diguanylate cyclase (GGDEF)-like protein